MISLAYFNGLSMTPKNQHNIIFYGTLKKCTIFCESAQMRWRRHTIEDSDLSWEQGV
jgi:hypothetical protein